MPSLKIRHLLVAGGGGFLGSAFVRDRLRGDPDLKITVLDRRDDAVPDLAGDPRVTVVRGDVTDAAVVRTIAKDTDATINFASDEFAEPPADSAGLARTDAEGTAVLLEAARSFRHQRFLLVSSVQVYASSHALIREEDLVAPVTMPAAVRAGAEMIAMAYATSDELAIIVTRNVVAYGPGQPTGQLVAGWICDALQDKPLMLADKGETERDYLHVDDQVSALARALWKGQPRTIYNVGSGIPVRDSEMAHLILQLCGRPSSRQHRSKGGYEGRRIVDARRMRPLGWEPKIPLRVGLQAAIAWYRNRASIAHDLTSSLA